MTHVVQACFGYELRDGGARALVGQSFPVSHFSRAIGFVLVLREPLSLEIAHTVHQGSIINMLQSTSAPKSMYIYNTYFYDAL